MIEPGAEGYLKLPEISLNQQELLSHGDIVWTNGITTMFYPENPLVPASEGIHLRIDSPTVPIHPQTPDEWKGWLTHWTLMIGAGKVVSEGAALPDMWQSFVGQNEFTPKDHLVTDLIGRNPTGESWGKTAPFPGPDFDFRNSRVDASNVAFLSRTMERFFRSVWMPEVPKVKLFDAPIVVDVPGSPHFQEVFNHNNNLPYPWQSDPMLVSNYFDILYIRHPHLKTQLHFMVGVKDAPRRPWRDIPRALQGLAAAETTAQLLEETQFDGKPIAAWTSVRATGSWYQGFQEFNKHPEMLTAPRKGFKRQFRDSEGELFGGDMHFHPHIYGARHSDEKIELMQRPRDEGGKDWEGITEIPVPVREAVRDVLNATLVDRLNVNAHGAIVK